MTYNALDVQRMIYIDGMAGRTPLIPLTFRELEESARRVMTPKAFAYVAGGAGEEKTVNRNMSDFSRYGIRPRMLKNVGSRDTSITLFQRNLKAPLLLAPVGVLELAHPEGDLAVAHAAAQSGVPMIFSNQASVSMEACSTVMGPAPRWFQLYWSKSRELVASFVQRAERCGCEAIVVTLDTTMLGWRTRDLALGYLPFLEGKGIAQYTSDPAFQRMLDEDVPASANRPGFSYGALKALISMVNRYPGTGFFSKMKSGRPVRAVRKFIETYSNPCTTWDDLSFLRDQTRLPIVLKGILHPEDAVKAVDHGMDGIIVSNHGGRQVDGAISSIRALPEIVQSVDGRIPILLDSGVRGGADIFKAIALGATAVCIGRPYVYALSLGGKQGVAELLRNYIAEFELTMGLAGCRAVSEIKPNAVVLQ